MKYIASCSFGKDSIATILLARENNEPLDEIVYCEVMFDENISGELPEHRDFIYNVAIPKFEEWGYKVTVLRSKETYMDVFFHIVEKPRKHQDRKGKKRKCFCAALCNWISITWTRSVRTAVWNFSSAPWRLMTGISILSSTPTVPAIWALVLACRRCTG